MTDIFLSYTERDRDTARRIADPRVRAREFGRLLLDWLARDLEGALVYVRRLPAGPEYTRCAVTLFVPGLASGSDPKISSNGKRSMSTLAVSSSAESFLSGREISNEARPSRADPFALT